MVIESRTPAAVLARRSLLKPGAVDALVAVAAAAFAVAALADGLGDGGTPTGRSYVVAVVAGLSLVARRHRPMAVLCLVVLGRLFVTWDVGNELALTPAAVVSLYTVARHSDRRIGLVVASLAALIMALTASILGDEQLVHELLGEGAQGLFPIAVGDAVRTRAERMRDLIEAEAGARVQAERLRIARDLHDVVAHGLATIAVQSGIAAHLFDRSPERAREALEIINSTGKASLEELRAMVGVLRSTDSVPLRPTPADPNDISEVVAGATRAGVDVSCEVVGEFPPDASDAAVVAVHRILQEALTNVARHGGSSPAEVRLDHRPGHALVQVLNVGNRRSGASIRRVASTGVGIVGMTERAESLGGRLDAGPTADGGYQVTAEIPYHRATT